MRRPLFVVQARLGFRILIALDIMIVVAIVWQMTGRSTDDFMLTSIVIYLLGAVASIFLLAILISAVVSGTPKATISPIVNGLVLFFLMCLVEIGIFRRDEPFFANSLRYHGVRSMPFEIQVHDAVIRGVINTLESRTDPFYFPMVLYIMPNDIRVATPTINISGSANPPALIIDGKPVSATEQSVLFYDLNTTGLLELDGLSWPTDVLNSQMALERFVKASYQKYLLQSASPNAAKPQPDG